MVVHLTTAAHEESLGDVAASVAASSGKLQLFEKVDMLALYLTIADEIERGGKSGKTRTDDIGGFLVNALRLLGVCK